MLQMPYAILLCADDAGHAGATPPLISFASVIFHTPPRRLLITPACHYDALLKIMKLPPRRRDAAASGAARRLCATAAAFDAADGDTALRAGAFTPMLRARLPRAELRCRHAATLIAILCRCADADTPPCHAAAIYATRAPCRALLLIFRDSRSYAAASFLPPFMREDARYRRHADARR